MDGETAKETPPPADKKQTLKTILQDESGFIDLGLLVPKPIEKSFKAAFEFLRNLRATHQTNWVAPRAGAWIETPNWAWGEDEPTDGGDVVSNPTAIKLLMDTLLIPLLVRTGKEPLAQFTVLGPFPSIRAGRIIMGCMLYL